ncbi:MAG: sigma-70 family RNA polymerase sigma factor [Candidatus Zixiibacteriota bacterium]|nr:MAG: sigma-70 family RNA polymerase sigma factor [candidate division Zixibacteria bacterium]
MDFRELLDTILCRLVQNTLRQRKDAMLNRETLPDLDLMRRVQEGEMVSYNTLVNRYKDRLFNVLYRMLSSEDEANDLLQETFLRVWQHKMSYDFRFAFSTWIYTIALNLARNELRRRKKIKFLDIFDFADKLAAKEEKKDTSTNLKTLLESEMKRLPEKYKTAFLLRDVDNLSYEEIAQVLGVPLGTVKSRVNRARAILRTRLKPRLEESYELSKGTVLPINIL